MAIQVVVALRQPQRDELPVVALRDPCQRLEAGTRLRPSPRGEETLRARQLAREAVGHDQRRRLQPLDAILRDVGLRAQREVVVDAAVGLKRVVLVTDRLFGRPSLRNTSSGTLSFASLSSSSRSSARLTVATRERDIGQPQRQQLVGDILRAARDARAVNMASASSRRDNSASATPV